MAVYQISESKIAHSAVRSIAGLNDATIWHYSGFVANSKHWFTTSRKVPESDAQCEFVTYCVAHSVCVEGRRGEGGVRARALVCMCVLGGGGGGSTC